MIVQPCNSFRHTLRCTFLTLLISISIGQKVIFVNRKLSSRLTMFVLSL